MGLSYSETGLYTSERHQEARESGKMTAGEAAKLISKKIKEKTNAKAVTTAFETHFGYAPEWHHAGFYKAAGQKKKVMGRTFFFDDEQIAELIENWPAIKEKVIAADFQAAAEEKRQRETEIIGFYYEWDHDHHGAYGKKRNFKRLHVYEGDELGKPKNFTPCDAAEAEVAKLFDGKQYCGWDEPSHSDFTKAKADAFFERKRMQEQAELERKLAAEKAAACNKEKDISAVKILDAMAKEFIDSGVDFLRKNASWYVYSKFFEGTQNAEICTCGRIEYWMRNYISSMAGGNVERVLL